MRDLGYIDGRNATTEWRWLEGRTNRLPAQALELVQLNVDIIIATSTQSAWAAMQATSSEPCRCLVLSNPVNFKHRQLIADFALKSRLPSIYEERSFV